MPHQELENPNGLHDDASFASQVLSNEDILTPRKIFGVYQWDVFVEQLFSVIVLASAEAGGASKDDLNWLSGSLKARRAFEAVVWFFLHYFFLALPVPKKMFARHQLHIFTAWVKADMALSEKYPELQPKSKLVGKSLLIDKRHSSGASLQLFHGNIAQDSDSRHPDEERYVPAAQRRSLVSPVTESGSRLKPTPTTTRTLESHLGSIEFENDRLYEVRGHRSAGGASDYDDGDPEANYFAKVQRTAY